MPSKRLSKSLDTVEESVPYKPKRQHASNNEGMASDLHAAEVRRAMHFCDPMYLRPGQSPRPMSPCKCGVPLWHRAIFFWGGGYCRPVPRPTITPARLRLMVFG